MKPAASVFTIGFTKKTAEQFFTALRDAGVKRVVDVRLNNSSQLAGFSKRDDLKFFLKGLAGIDYIAEPLLAPTQPMLDRYRKDGGNWDTYAQEFLALMEQRKIEDQIDPELVDGGCLLCSEDKPHRCHRRLVAEYLQGRWGNLKIEHLG
jgi:uncharacterized protein (DUF488 family)